MQYDAIWMSALRNISENMEKTEIAIRDDNSIWFDEDMELIAEELQKTGAVPEKTEVSIIETMLEARIYKLGHFISDSPGFTGRLYLFIWGGGPEFHILFGVTRSSKVLEEGESARAYIFNSEFAPSAP